jgi:hypothetical protein
MNGGWLGFSEWGSLNRFGEPWNEIEVQHQGYNTLTIRRLFLPMRGDSLDRAAFGRCMSTLYSAKHSAIIGLGIEVRGKTGAAGL